MRRFFRIAAITKLFFLTVYLYSCTEYIGEQIPSDGKQVFQNVAKPGGYNIWLGDHTADEFIAEVEAKTGVTVNRDTQLRKCPCGDNIINIDYPGMVFEGHGPAQVKAPSGQGGNLSSGIEIAKNLIFSRDEQSIKNIHQNDAALLKKQMKALEGSIKGGQKTVKLAILDSGIDTSLPLSYLGVPPTGDASCLTDQFVRDGQAVPQKLTGFNYAPLDEGTGAVQSPDFLNVTDTHADQHGTRVALIAARQFANSSKTLQMLVMRVLNNQNKGDSFGIICAMISAKKLGAQIINMSLGYYGDRDGVFEAAFNTLNDNPAKPVWIVMAAGNYKRGLDVIPDYYADPRNRDLGLRPVGSQFFPANFNNSVNNRLITATTTFESLNEVCIGQNYGKDYVDLAVNAPGCNVPSGLISTGVDKQGTSFAAPAVAGWLGTQSDLHRSKNQILAGSLKGENLSNFVRDGAYIKAK